MTNAALAAFYNNPDLADGFGSTKNRPNPHYGLDFAKALGTPVPCLVGGTVVISEWSDALGNIVEVRGDDNRYQGYRHLRSAARRAELGARVEVGDIIGQVSDTGSAADGYHLCTTNGSGKGAVKGGPLCSDPWAFIPRYIDGNAVPVIVPATGGASGVGPILRSGADWAYRHPTGELCKRVQRALIGKQRLSPNYAVDGVAGELFDKAVQRTLNISGKFKGLEDGIIERGGSYGIQDYGIAYGDYTKLGGIRDGRPEGLSWASFALGLERP